MKYNAWYLDIFRPKKDTIKGSIINKLWFRFIGLLNRLFKRSCHSQGMHLCKTIYKKFNLMNFKKYVVITKCLICGCVTKASYVHNMVPTKELNEADKIL
jgi:hypothetical protein